MNTGENVSLLDKNVPKLPLDRDKTGATGSGDYLLNALNLGFETLGLKQPFGEVSSAKKYLDSINVDLINVILADKTGKAAKDEREEIRRILPNMSAFVGGDETAAEKITGDYQPLTGGLQIRFAGAADDTVATANDEWEIEVMGAGEHIDASGVKSVANTRWLN